MQDGLIGNASAVGAAIQVSSDEALDSDAQPEVNDQCLAQSCWQASLCPVKHERESATLASCPLSLSAPRSVLFRFETPQH